MPNYYIRLNREVKEDLNLWLSFLSNFNGKSFFLEDTWLNSPKLGQFTDASGALGFGNWPSNW